MIQMPKFLEEKMSTKMVHHLIGLAAQTIQISWIEISNTSKIAILGAGRIVLGKRLYESSYLCSKRYFRISRSFESIIYHILL